jgi:hypothetical protein
VNLLVTLLPQELTLNANANANEKSHQQFRTWKTRQLPQVHENFEKPQKRLTISKEQTVAESRQRNLKNTLSATDERHRQTAPKIRENPKPTAINRPKRPTPIIKKPKETGAKALKHKHKKVEVLKILDIERKIEPEQNSTNESVEDSTEFRTAKEIEVVEIQSGMNTAKTPNAKKRFFRSFKSAAFVVRLITSLGDSLSR